VCGLDCPAREADENDCEGESAVGDRHSLSERVQIDLAGDDNAAETRALEGWCTSALFGSLNKAGPEQTRRVVDP
jgi:hypothetical protein